MTQNTLSAQADTLAQEARRLRAELGYNCAQAVATALAPLVGLDADTAYRLAEGFGGGVGGTHREICGALSGAIMIASARMSAGTGAPGQTKQETYARIRTMLARFQEQNGAIGCAELKGIGSDHGPLRDCQGCVEDAVRLACRALDELERA